MRGTVFRMILVASVCFCAYGCRRPHLASRPLSEQETLWAQFIQRSYSGWDPPYLSPVAGENTAPLPVPVDAVAVAPRWRAPVESSVPAPGHVVPAAAEEIELIPVGGTAPPPTQAADTLYTVLKGDTFSGIARKLYGDAGDWRRIWQHNRDVVGESPDKLRPGMVLKIPR